MSKIHNGSIVFTNIPYNEHNPHQHYGGHFYVIVANSQACNYSPVVQAIPLSSNIRRRLPVQIEIHADCFPKRSFALAEQLTLLPREFLERGTYYGTLSPSAMEKVKEAIKIQLSLD